MAKVTPQAEESKIESEEYVEEIALARLTEEDLWTLSQESLSLWSWTVLSLALRAKGMGLYSLIQGGASAAQSYGISLVLSYFFFPETSGLSLEEIDTVFETPGVAPVKMSLDMEKAKKEMAMARRDEKGRSGL
ncbi:hypothetical protein N7486_008612 [Penicillium sp. IBT 16267x]|nr:hypothetical protein N7486_008612 [Penicillium sp. IBT 16267x]